MTFCGWSGAKYIAGGQCKIFKFYLKMRSTRTYTYFEIVISCLSRTQIFDFIRLHIKLYVSRVKVVPSAAGSLTALGISLNKALQFSFKAKSTTVKRWSDVNLSGFYAASCDMFCFFNTLYYVKYKARPSNCCSVTISQSCCAEEISRGWFFYTVVVFS